MPSPASLNKPTFTVCPVCNGAGRLRTLSCTNCDGMGLGSLFEGRFYFFNLALSPAAVRMRGARQLADKIINISASVVAGIGFLCLGWWLYAYGRIDEAVITVSRTALRELMFWEARHGLLFIFWLAMIPLLFVMYRRSRARDLEHRIEHPTYRSEQDAADPVLEWKEVIRLPKSKRVNVAEGADEAVQKILEQSVILAASFQHPSVESLELFAAIMFVSPQASALFSRLSVPDQKLVEGIERQLNAVPRTPLDVVFGAEARQVMVEAYISAYKAAQEKVRALDLIGPCISLNQQLTELLYALEVDTTKLTNAIAWFKVTDQLVENYKAYRRMAKYKPSSNMDRAYTAVATPLLDRFSYDWTLAAKWGRVDICVGRDKEVRSVFDRIESGQTGIILTGPAGVGKSSIIGGIAQLMVLENVPPLLQDKRLIEVDLARLIGGSTAAEAEDRLLSVINEVSRAGNIILYMKDLERIMGISSGGEQSLDLGSVLSDAVSRRVIICFASATSEHYTKYIEKTSLGETLARVEVNEPEINEAILMVESKVGFMESKYNVYFSYNALADVVTLTDKYIHDKYLPNKAIDALESVAVKVSRQADRTVTREAIAEVITELTHIPVTKLTESESQNLLNLEDKIHERMIGQEEAVTMVAAALRRARVELREGKRPIANFLFLGPTGVGKTELAKTVAETYFGREDYMIRLDMSEYQNKDSVAKMIGDQTGVQGYLTEAVRKMPFSLILLDEIEKAHPDILNLFLQVMDDGRLTDGQGRTIDFTNSILIATSNVGSALIQEHIRAGKAIEAIKEELIEKELIKAMRPELINRFDGVIIFKPLDQDNVVAIAKLMMKKIARMLDDKGYGFEMSETALRKLAELGFDPEYGARPLRRLLQEKVEDAIATKILEGGISRRDTLVIGDDLTITVTKAPSI